MVMAAGKNTEMFHEKNLLQSINRGFKYVSPKNKGSYIEGKESKKKKEKKNIHTFFYRTELECFW